jgi:recombination associated protein RdgC
MQLKGIKFLEGVFDGRPDDAESGFDTDVALATGEMTKLIPDLVEALGGELVAGPTLGEGCAG